MKAIKENREYTITPDVKQSFIKEGYDIIDDDGNITDYGAGKTVPFQRYIDLVEKYTKLDAETTKLRKELAELKEKTKAPKGRAKKGE